jgi:hypothetical protein
MLDMFINGATLFFRGKLFQDNAKVISQLLLGSVIAATLLVVLTKVGLPLWLSGIVAGFVAGAGQPWLFRNLKYR